MGVREILVSKSFKVLLLFAAISISAWTSMPGEPETGPYQFNYPKNFGNRINTPDNNPTTKQGVYLGRLLFYETKLSANNKLSCAGCHQQEKAFTDGKAFSTGVDNVPTSRNSMSLANLLWARKLFWDGRAASLEEQAAVPLTSPHEMGQSLRESASKLSSSNTYRGLFKMTFGDDNITGQRICMAISQFERTLISCNSRYDRYLAHEYTPTKEELNGMNLFMNSPYPQLERRGANCSQCHGGAKTYLELFHNNGLDSIPKDAGIEAITGLTGDCGRFKVPTLRNIALTAPYMHDGRFKTLAGVLDHYSEHVKESPSLSTFLRNESNDVDGKTLNLRPEEKRDIIAFLNMLTDSAFVTNPQFAAPDKLSAR
ncbi:MAG: cytochrome c peroxidase [Bacteroidota bacterium]